jgi:hypothetical protein
MASQSGKDAASGRRVWMTRRRRLKLNDTPAYTVFGIAERLAAFCASVCNANRFADL